MNIKALALATLVLFGSVTQSESHSSNAEIAVGVGAAIIAGAIASRRGYYEYGHYPYYGVPVVPYGEFYYEDGVRHYRGFKNYREPGYYPRYYRYDRRYERRYDRRWKRHKYRQYRRRH